MNRSITVEVQVTAGIDKVWKFWNEPKYIMQWTHATDDWHTPMAKNDLKVGGRFVTTMAARDGSAQFDFEGIYTNIKPQQIIEYEIPDGRKVKVEFKQKGNTVKVIETFDMESINPEERQRQGWQSILDNFKKLVESSK